MDKLAETYQKGIAKIKAKDYQQAMAFFERVFQENAGFLSVCYYLGKCHYFLREFDEAEKFLELHTKNDTEKNLCQQTRQGKSSVFFAGGIRAWC